jgi:hypothetical protein
VARCVSASWTWANRNKNTSSRVENFGKKWKKSSGRSWTEDFMVLNREDKKKITEECITS